MVRGALRAAAILVVLVSHQAGAADLEALRAQARAAGLASDPQWLALLHYHSRLGPRPPRSLIDDPAFFLAPTGAVDPAAELDATLLAFAGPAPRAGGDDDPRCLWPARWRWLSSRLPLARGENGQPACPALEAWLAAIDPGSATLVFPAAYLNNPSSMFGHTFLRIDPPRQEGATPLASYAVNYGAVTGSDGGVLFAVRGLTGGYKGYYSIQPYYVSVRTYSDLESRDIWEYELSLDSGRGRSSRPQRLGAARPLVRLLLPQGKLLLHAPVAPRRGAAQPAARPGLRSLRDAERHGPPRPGGRGHPAPGRLPPVGPHADQLAQTKPAGAGAEPGARSRGRPAPAR